MCYHQDVLLIFYFHISLTEVAEWVFNLLIGCSQVAVGAGTGRCRITFLAPLFTPGESGDTSSIWICVCGLNRNCNKGWIWLYLFTRGPPSDDEAQRLERSTNVGGAHSELLLSTTENKHHLRVGAGRPAAAHGVGWAGFRGFKVTFTCACAACTPQRSTH